MTNNNSIEADKIAVALITYNESRFLSHVLASVANVFPSFVMLDMGSSDQTMTIARDMLGSRLICEQWPRTRLFVEGFASARNEVSSLSNLPYILHVDADEILSKIEDQGDALIEEVPPKGSEEIWKVRRRNLKGPAPDSFDLKTLQALPTTSVEFHARLYRKSDRLKWHGYIHEQITVDGVRLNERAQNSHLNLDHLSLFRPEDERLQKEKLYAWMLLNACNNSSLKGQMWPEFIQHTKENIGWLHPLAVEFGEKNQLNTDWEFPLRSEAI